MEGPEGEEGEETTGSPSRLPPDQSLSIPRASRPSDREEGRGWGRAIPPQPRHSLQSSDAGDEGRAARATAGVETPAGPSD